jgi:photosystem II stability/assembly factor-like uncharacterized protein
MSKYWLFFILYILLSPKASHAQKHRSLEMDTIFKKEISIRAILIDGDKVWYAGDHNQVGFYNWKSHQREEVKVQGDSIPLQFRSIAHTTDFIFVANIGNPAGIYKIQKSNLAIQKVYSETDPKVFYDSLQFWNDKEGIALGDPTGTCLSITITRDGGNSWQKISCDQLPPVEEGEAAFAASNTNICIQGTGTWLVSGGTKARVFYSSNKGASWEVFNTPIAQGSAMSGIFTADFYDNRIGIIAGGNYEAPSQNFQNKALTQDGGKTWQLLADHAHFGYASCIQFVPKTKAREIVSMGATGIYYSSNQGADWEQLSSEASLYTLRFLTKTTAFAAGKNSLIQLTFK